MMICPACNYELLLHNDYCENCGAPAYLVTAAQTADLTHCTYCGARDESVSGDCAICGLKKNFKTSENLIGTCRNCGVVWRNVWMYCQTCGVARENGLVETTFPITVSFQPDTSPLSTSNRSYQAAYSFSHNPPREQYESVADSRDVFFTYPDFDLTAESARQMLLSESEVVERMYANGEDENITSGKLDLEEFFSESEIADSRQPTAFHQVSQVKEFATSGSEIVYELPLAAQCEPAVAPPLHADMNSQPVSLLPENKSQSVLPLDSATKQAEVTAQVKTPLPTQKSKAAPQTQRHTSAVKTEATSAATAASKTAAKPIQTVRVINRVRPPTTPPIDRKLVKIIAVLIFLVLLFSALIVSGFRLRDLFGKPRPQARPLAEASPSSVPMQPEILPAPEGMVKVPGGVFRMGTDEGDSFESPAHEVTIAPFFMDRTEVTNAQYAEFLKATNHRSPPDWKDGKYPPGTEKFPVVNVSWQDANDYAAWAGKRLPTEAEWEFAARAKDGRHYPWGSNWDATKANTSESNLNHPVEVGSYASAANPLGLLDMVGNVWEWTAGEVMSYKDSSIALAPGKVIRGGAFYAPKERASTTFRGFAPPDKQATGIGFRCLKEGN